MRLTLYITPRGDVTVFLEFNIQTVRSSALHNRNVILTHSKALHFGGVVLVALCSVFTPKTIMKIASSLEVGCSASLGRLNSLNQDLHWRMGDQSFSSVGEVASLSIGRQCTRTFASRSMEGTTQLSSNHDVLRSCHVRS